MHADAIWGTGFYKTMSQSLKEEFPSVSGFSVTNLKYMKRFLNSIKAIVQIVNRLLTIWKKFVQYLGTPYFNNDKM